MNRKGILLINLGSPDSPTITDVHRYLREFLMDPRVLDVPWLLRAFLVHCCILPTRSKKSAEAYAKIWTPKGSPLVATSREVQCALQQRLGEDVPVELAMRYQNPGIASALINLQKKKVSDLLVIPLFPQYARSSYETAAARVKELAAKVAPNMRLRLLLPFFDNVAYIHALVASASDYLEKGFDHLLFSFHGLPERHLRKADPTGCHCFATPDCCEKASPAHRTCYRAQCLATVRAFSAAACIPRGKVSIAFQSRIGSEPWLKPFSDAELKRLAQTGVKKLMLICPAFVADCLETLEEIAIRGRETFLNEGGAEFTLIPCLNTHPQWIEALKSMAERHFN